MKAEVLSLSERQVGWIIQRVREEGEGGIMHRLRFRESSRRIPEAANPTGFEVRERVTQLYEEAYVGFGPTL